MAIARSPRRSRFSKDYDPRGRYKRRGKAMGEMNVTPFIDVLLVVFQETPPTRNRGIHGGDSYAP